MLKNKLKSWRHKLEMNQTEFAEFMGVSLGTYNQWEKHKREPALESAWVIVKKLRSVGHDCHIDDLYEETSE